MKLDRIIINLRDRTAWEAMDLGTRLVIGLTKQILLPWLAIISIFIALSIYIQISGYSFIGLFVFWLFKPLYDSLLLYILSNELFSEKINIKIIVRDLSIWLLPGIKHSLYWWRLSPMRSFIMPVHNLESLSGQLRKKRLHILQKNISGYATGLTFIAINYEVLINLSLYVIFAFLLPDELYSSVWGYFEGSDESTAGLVMNTVFYGLAVFLIEPLYVGAGFLLYLNRRVKLEAWDIELVFKQINSRLEKKYSDVIQ